MSHFSVNNKALKAFGSAALRFENNATVRAITDGLINLIPIVLIGSVFLAIGNLPIPGFHDLLDGVTGGNWTLITNMVTFITEDIIALAALISISLTIAMQNQFMKRHEISPFFPLFTAFSCYVALFVWDPALYSAATEGEVPSALFDSPGRTGVFGALLVSLVAAKLFIVFAKLWQKHFGFRWKVIGNNQLVRISIRAVVPVACTLTCFIVFRFLLDWFFVGTDAQQLLDEVIANIVNDGSFAAVILTVLMTQILWFFGAHGSDTMQSLMEGSIETAAASGNTVSALFTNSDVYSIFIDMGGTGTGMALLLALLIFGAANRERRLARISIFPVIFNINETLLFGVPIVLSPFMIIPFVLAPVISATVIYAAFSLGVVPPLTAHVEWTTPMLLSGYMATGSIAGSFLQLINVGLGFLVYTPFVLIAKHAHEDHQQQLFEDFKKEARCAANGEQGPLVNRRDAIGEMTRDFISELHLYFEQDNIPFYMVYQPKTDKEGTVVGAEALLRGTHPRYGAVPPDILIELTDEAELSTPLARWITTKTLEEFARWRAQGITQIVLSINLNPHHLHIDTDYPVFLKTELDRLAIDPSLIELEITEHVAVHPSESALDMFRRLRALGVELSIDDMGMGYSSLTYISDFGVSVVKIDVSLINQVTVNQQQQEIVRSVLDLAKQINLAVVVEGVETKEQVEVLVSLGCRYFQGYYFSKPLTPEDFLEYIKEHGTARLEHEHL